MPSEEQPVEAPLRVSGKWLYKDGLRVLLHGATYGTFADHDGQPFPARDQVAADFAQMTAAGINTVRTYTVPPLWLLDLASSAGLWIMAGLPWEQHLTFLAGRSRARSIETRLRADVRACAGHPAVIAYAVGNEIPASIIRFHGPHRVERFLKRLAKAVRQEAPGALVTYVNYPSTEYLDLPFLDLVCFNVFLEEASQFEAYVARLQSLAGERPLVLAEIGLDSRRHGERAQGRSVAGQLRAAYQLGVAGAFVFSWTDEWHRGGAEIEDWDFGLVDRSRRPKPALAAVSDIFADPIGSHERDWPRASVIVCSFNGERWLRGCLEALARLEYPHYEVIVVDDGSTDATASIAKRFAGVHLVSTTNGGLSRARNVGLAAADGTVVAFVDDDTRPDPSWLTHLVLALVDSGHVAVGGPNISPPDDGMAAECVAGAPGGPAHVLIDDREAEHVPGCNMAFYSAVLREVGGFDAAFRIAGDDVDLCWRLHERGETIGFAASAMVWHHPRPSVRGYLLQQFRYGEAEALLERKWPERYNRRGHVSWAGSVYGNSHELARGRRPRIRYGEWGTAPFQSRETTPVRWWGSAALSAEWYVGVCALVLLGALGTRWAPLLAALPLAGLAVGATIVEASLAAARVAPPHSAHSRSRMLLRGIVTAGLHMLQPAVRLSGRLHLGLSPWRRTGTGTLRKPTPRTDSVWLEHWASPEQRLGDLELTLTESGNQTHRGGAYDRWDLQVRGGIFGRARLRAGTEEHGHGRQMIRLRVWPVPSSGGSLAAGLLLLLAVSALGDGARQPASLLAAGGLVLAAWCVHDCAAAVGAFRLEVLERGLARRTAAPPAVTLPLDRGLLDAPPWTLSFLELQAPPVPRPVHAPALSLTAAAETERTL